MKKVKFSKIKIELFIVSMVFLIVGITLCLVEAINYKTTDADIVGVSNPHCMITAGHRGRRATYGVSYKVEYFVDNVRYTSKTGCIGSQDYRKIEMLYNKKDPSKTLTGRSFLSYKIIALVWGVIFGIICIFA